MCSASRLSAESAHSIVDEAEAIAQALEGRKLRSSVEMARRAVATSAASDLQSETLGPGETLRAKIR